MARPRRIVSGGQTGADRGGLDAAIALGIPHGGWCPRGRRAEDGRVPARYRLRETASDAYPARTERNVAWSDGTVVFTSGRAEGGTALTLRLARKHGKPHVRIDLSRTNPAVAARRLREWIAGNGIGILNVAGPRESRAPGIRAGVEKIVMEALRHESPVRRLPYGRLMVSEPQASRTHSTPAAKKRLPLRVSPPQGKDPFYGGLRHE